MMDENLVAQDFSDLSSVLDMLWIYEETRLLLLSESRFNKSKKLRQEKSIRIGFNFIIITESKFVILVL